MVDVGHDGVTEIRLSGAGGCTPVFAQLHTLPYMVRRLCAMGLFNSVVCELGNLNQVSIPQNLSLQLIIEFSLKLM